MSVLRKPLPLIRADGEEAAWNVDEAAAELPQLSDSDEESDDQYYFITSRIAPGGDIYQASRVGDLERVQCARPSAIARVCSRTIFAF